MSSSLPSRQPKEPLTFSEFLECTKTLRTIYSKIDAQAFFEENLDYYFKPLDKTANV